MTTEDVRNETFEQATPETPNTGDVIMGEQERKHEENNQPLNDRKEVKTMSNNLNDYLILIEGADPETGAVIIKGKEYDGSRQPMVIKDNLLSSEAISNAFLRIKVRYNFLMKEYFRCKSILEDESKSPIDRKIAKDKIGEIDGEKGALEKLQALKAIVEKQEKVVEESVKAELVDTNVSLEHSFKF